MSQCNKWYLEYFTPVLVGKDQGSNYDGISDVHQDLYNMNYASKRRRHNRSQIYTESVFELLVLEGSEGKILAAFAEGRIQFVAPTWWHLTFFNSILRASNSSNSRPNTLLTCLVHLHTDRQYMFPTPYFLTFTRGL